jgi:hypothetical protein
MLIFSVQKVKSYIKGGINYNNTQFDNVRNASQKKKKIII